MKNSNLILLVLSISVISASAPASQRAQATWGGAVVKHIKQHWDDQAKERSSKLQDENAKVKLTVSNSGQISDAIELSCKGSLTFCSSVSKALIKANPFPVPPKSLKKSDRTLTITLD